MARNDRSREPLLSLRSAVVFLISLQAAAAAGFLTASLVSGPAGERGMFARGLLIRRGITRQHTTPQ
jgi:hypothetical protein